MPVTVNGYHLWQLPAESSREPSETIGFTELENDMGDGYFSQALYGSAAGTRKWKLKLPSLAGLSILPNTVTGINGESLSREQYLWDLFCETKITGLPFVYQSQKDGQYYLARFADKDLTYEKMRVQIYTTGVEIRQVRISGVTVYDPTILSVTRNVYNETTHNAGSTQWDVINSTPYWGFMEVGGDEDVIFDANPQNGKNTVRMNSTTGEGWLATTLGGIATTDVFLVMKMREATFSNNCGVLTKNTGLASQFLLKGTSGDTKFQDPSQSNFEYRLNGLLYTQSNMQAPMNTFGIVHLRRTGTSTSDLFSGWGVVQLGQDRDVVGTFAKMDIAEMIFIGQNAGARYFRMEEVRALTEHLAVKWGIGIV